MYIELGEKMMGLNKLKDIFVNISQAEWVKEYWIN